MKTILRGELPALAVARADDGLWYVADCVNDTDDIDNLELVHLAHVVGQDPTLRELADLPRGVQAVRDFVGGTWERGPFELVDDLPEDGESATQG